MNKLCVMGMCLTMALAGCSTDWPSWVKDWFGDDGGLGTNLVVDPPAQTNADGFVVGEATWLGMYGPFDKSSKQQPLAQIASARVNGKAVSVTYGPDARKGEWWPDPDQYCYGHQVLCWKSTDGKWYAAMIESFPRELRGVVEFNNVTSKTAPFVTHGHPVVKGNPAYWGIKSTKGHYRSNFVRIDLTEWNTELH
jgi:hypothetical protein